MTIRLPDSLANSNYKFDENIENSIIKELLELNGCEPVVRCKDCEHYQSVRIGYPKFCTKHSHMAESDDYCSWAEREKDEN